MSKMSELDLTVKELRSAAEAINSAANALASLFSGKAETAPKKEDPKPEEPKPMTLPEVRAILAEKSRAGFTAEIKELLIKYGADKLSAIDPAKYADLVAEAEALTDAT